MTRRSFDVVTRFDELNILEPRLPTQDKTACRVRQRMRTTFKQAIAIVLIVSNLAGKSMDGALPSRPKLQGPSHGRLKVRKSARFNCNCRHSGDQCIDVMSVDPGLDRSSQSRESRIEMSEETFVERAT